MLNLPPIQLLYWANVAGGLGTPVGLVLLLLVAADPRVMGARRVSMRLLGLGWATTALVTITSLFFIGQQLRALLP